MGDTPEMMLSNLENETFSVEDINKEQKAASDHHYINRIRDISADTPARYNANSECLYEASGCAGKLAIFAVRLDTFPVPNKEKVFYLGTNNPETFSQLRRDILTHFKHLPETAEYMHRDCFNITEIYGKDTFLLINYLGTDFMPRLFAFKGVVDACLNKIRYLPGYLIDRLMQGLSQYFPQHLPKSMLEFRDRYEHHLILKVSDEGIAEAQRYLEKTFTNDGSNGYFICNSTESKKAYLHRYSVAGAAVRYQLVHSKLTSEVLALDIALQRRELEWFEVLPEVLADQIEKTLYYGHFLCHVFHQDYVLKAGADPVEFKAAMLMLLDKRGAKYPAEHNVGHLYQAEQGLADFYQRLDPSDTFNPGIGT